jgi:hypothetical protein
MHEVGISLGWNCNSASWASANGIRQLKVDGYKTCPFDLMVTNYEGIVQCIDEDFKYICDENYLVIREPRVANDVESCMIYNIRYKFGFNHESPGTAKLYISENWAGGPSHFVDNNYRLFKERYSRRADNFRNYLSDPDSFITFVHTTWNKTDEDMSDLKRVLKKHYPHLKYRIQLLNDPNGEEYFRDHMRYLESKATHIDAASRLQE